MYENIFLIVVKMVDGTQNDQDLSMLASMIHQDNRERGWWSDLKTGEPIQRNVGELLMLMVSEIGEIPLNHRHNIMDDKLPHRCMFEVELADCAIRILDTCGGIATGFFYGYREPQKNAEDYYIDKKLLAVIRHLSLALEGHRKNLNVVIARVDEDSVPQFDYQLGAALRQIFLIARAQEFDLASTIREKLIFNSRRQDHKVETRRAAGGKAF